MKKTGDQFLVKQINKSILLNRLMKQSPISRAALSEQTGLNKGTVSSLVQELRDEYFVEELGPGPSSGGRKPVMLHFNQHAGLAVGIDLGVNYLLTVLTDLTGHIIQRIYEPLSEYDFTRVSQKMINHTEQLVQQAPPSPYGLIGIGVGVPGMIGEDGNILFAPNLEWQHVDLKHVLHDHFQVPVSVDNEAHAGAIGEKQFGAGINISNLIYISVGVGIGTGIIIDDKIYRGSLGISGEMGHFSIDVNGKKCRCGNNGCWELYASEHALLELYAGMPAGPVAERNALPPKKANGERPSDDITQKNTAPGLQPDCNLRTGTTGSSRLKEENGNAVRTSSDILPLLVQMAERDQVDVIRIFESIGHYLGIGLTNIINTFNPQRIVIGGRMTMAQPWLEKPIHDELNRRLLPYYREQLDVQFSRLRTDSTVLGAAYVAISNFFDKRTVSVE